MSVLPRVQLDSEESRGDIALALSNDSSGNPPPLIYRGTLAKLHEEAIAKEVPLIISKDRFEIPKDNSQIHWRREHPKNVIDYLRPPSHSSKERGFLFANQKASREADEAIPQKKAELKKRSRYKHKSVSNEQISRICDSYSDLRSRFSVHQKKFSSKYLKLFEEHVADREGVSRNAVYHSLLGRKKFVDLGKDFGKSAIMKLEVVKMYNDGASLTDLSIKFKKSATTLYNVLHEFQNMHDDGNSNLEVKWHSLSSNSPQSRAEDSKLESIAQSGLKIVEKPLDLESHTYSPVTPASNVAAFQEPMQINNSNYRGFFEKHWKKTALLAATLVLSSLGLYGMSGEKSHPKDNQKNNSNFASEIAKLSLSNHGFPIIPNSSIPKIRIKDFERGGYDQSKYDFIPLIPKREDFLPNYEFGDNLVIQNEQGFLKFAESYIYEQLDNSKKGGDSANIR